jgi:hypothetical protein
MTATSLRRTTEVNKVRKHFPKRASIAIAALSAAATGVVGALGGHADFGGFGAPHEMDTTIYPVAYAPIGKATSNSVAPQPGEALQAAFTVMRPPAVSDATIGEPPRNSERVGPWFYATVHVRGLANGLDVEPMWEADLLQGATAEASSTSPNLHDAIAGSTFDAVLPDGEVVHDEAGGMGDVASGQEFSTKTSAEARAEIEQKLKDYGLVPISMTFFRSPTSAPAIVVMTDEPKKTATAFVPLIRSLFGFHPDYVGYYLEVLDSKGIALIRASAEFRTGAGRFWIKPELARFSGEKHAGGAPPDK